MPYHSPPSFNIGIEEEYQFIDPQSRELLGYATQSMSRGAVAHPGKAAGVGVCPTPRQ